MAGSAWRLLAVAAAVAMAVAAAALAGLVSPGAVSAWMEQQGLGGVAFVLFQGRLPTQAERQARARAEEALRTQELVREQYFDSPEQGFDVETVRFDYYQSAGKRPRPLDARVGASSGSVDVLDCRVLGQSERAARAGEAQDEKEEGEEAGGEGEGEQEELAFLDGVEVVQNHVSFRTPVLCEQSPAEEWASLQWDLWNLSKRVYTLQDVMHQKDPLFMPIVEAEDTMAFTTPEESQTLSELYFWNFLFVSTDPSQYMFYAGPWRQWQREYRISEPGNWKDFRIHDPILEKRNMTHTLNESYPFLWMLHPGGAVQTRYDPAHSFRVQMQGSAKYTLFHARHLRSMHLYPSTHVHHKQSQVRLEDIDLERFPHMEDVDSVEAIVHPGQALYIPPYWMYRVEALNFSVSLNVRSPSLEQVELLHAYWTRLPLQNVSDTEPERVVGGQLYLVQFLSRIEGLSSPRKLARSLYKTRYVPLFQKPGKNEGDPPISTEGLDKDGTPLEPVNCMNDQGSIAYKKEILRQVRPKPIQDAAAYMAAIVNNEDIHPTIRYIFATDYVEHVARFAVGPDRAPLFIRDCLDYDKLEIVEEMEGPSVLRFDV